MFDIISAVKELEDGNKTGLSPKNQAFYPKIVLSLDRVDFSSNGIRHRYLPDFLLEQSHYVKR